MTVALVYGRNVFQTGVERYARSLEGGLRALGQDVRGVPLTRRELRVLGRPVGGYVSLWMARLLDRTRGYDVIHALDPAVATGRSDVVTIHDLVVEAYPDLYQRDLASRLDWRLTRRFASRAPWLVTVSEATRQEVLKRWGLDPERVVAIHSGIDHARFRRVEAGDAPHAAPDRPNLVYVGDDNPRKNLRLAVEAVALLKERHGIDARLLRLGPTRFPHVHEAYRAMAKARGVDLVEPGFVDDEGLVRVLSRADAFLWPPFAEGFGFPPLEAMACGAPVVALDTPINREIVGPTGRYHANDPDAAADAIAATLRAPPARADVVAHARSFTWRRTAERTLAVYEKVLASR